MARVTGALFSMDASGQLGKALVYAKWKGRQYCREYVVPENPHATKQVNVRDAFSLTVIEYQGLSAPDQLLWDAYAKPFQMSGFNKYMGHGVAQYKIQLTTSVNPASVTCTGIAPADTWVWA